MKWKTLVLTIIVAWFIIAMTGFASAWEWDNCGKYNETTRTMTIINAFCLGETIAKVTLLSPDDVEVVPGDDRKVAWFKIENFQEYAGEDAFGVIDVYDLNNNNETLKKNFKYKKKKIEEKEYSYYKTVCVGTGNYYPNGTQITTCHPELVQNTTTVVEWQAFNKNSLLEIGNYTLGLFTEVKRNERAEWVGTFFGVRIHQWAAWTSAYEVGLATAWTFEEASGNLIDVFSGLNNATNSGASYQATGINNYGWDFEAGDPDKADLAAFNGEGESITVNVWIKPESLPANANVLGIGTEEVAQTLQMTIQTDGDFFCKFHDNAGTAATATASARITAGIWTMITCRSDAATDVTSIYVNGTWIGNGSSGAPIDMNGGYAWVIGDDSTPEIPYDGIMDEMYVWNTSKSDSFIADLYDNGVGTFYDTGITVEMNSPEDNFISTNSTVSFSCNTTVGTGTVVNASLWTNQSGTFQAENITVGLVGAVNTTTWSHNLGLDNNYFWNCQGCGSDGSCAFASANRTVLVDTTTPALTATAPSIIDYYYVGKLLAFNWTVNDTNLGTCWYDYNQTNTTVTCSNTGEEITILDSINNSLTFYANDTVGHINSSFLTWSYRTFENSQGFVTDTVETAQENFNISLVTNETDTYTAVFVYNNTRHTSTTKVGSGRQTNFTKTIILPLSTVSRTENRTFYWEINVTNSTGSAISNSETQSHNVYFANFTLCQPGNYIPYINFTFKDEGTSSLMSAKLDLSSWAFWLGDGSLTRTLSFSNTSAPNPGYDFCFSPADRSLTVNLTFKYSNLSYPQRTFLYEEQELTNSTTNKVLYLLGTADGIYSSISVIESTGSQISGVKVTIEREIGGVWTIFEIGITDSSGLVTFWVNPNYDHRITATKIGYIASQVIIRPSQSLYTLAMAKTTEPAAYSSQIPGVTWYVRPGSGTLDVGVRNFNLTVTSSENNLENCSLELVNATNVSQILSQNSGLTNATYCFINIVYTLQNNQKIFGWVGLDTTNTTGIVYVDKDYKWIIIDIDKKAWRTVTNFFEELKDLSEFGEGNKAEFSRLVFFFVLTTIFISVFTYFYPADMTSPGINILVIWIIIIFASVGGFLTFESGSDNVDSVLEQYGFMFMFTLIASGYYLNAWRKQS